MCVWGVLARVLVKAIHGRVKGHEAIVSRTYQVQTYYLVRLCAYYTWTWIISCGRIMDCCITVVEVLLPSITYTTVLMSLSVMVSQHLSWSFG